MISCFISGTIDKLIYLEWLIDCLIIFCLPKRKRNETKRRATNFSHHPSQDHWSHSFSPFPISSIPCILTFPHLFLSLFYSSVQLVASQYMMAAGYPVLTTYKMIVMIFQRFAPSFLHLALFRGCPRLNLLRSTGKAECLKYSYDDKLLA